MFKLPYRNWLRLFENHILRVEFIWPLIFYLYFYYMKPHIYIDTSVLGGYFDEEFKNQTFEFFKRVFNEDFIVYYSEINELELVSAPKHIIELKDKIPASILRTVSLTKEAEDLAEMYVIENALGKASMNDAYHIAISTINHIDCLVSWNFKHIVNFNKIKLFNSVNLKLGYSTIDIRTPLEFIGND